MIIKILILAQFVFAVLGARNAFRAVDELLTGTITNSIVIGLAMSAFMSGGCLVGAFYTWLNIKYD